MTAHAPPLRPTPGAIRKEVATIFDRAAPAYDRIIPFFGGFASDLVAWHRLPPGGRALDLCTGTGACLLALARAPRSGPLVGVDVSSGMLARARSALRETGDPGQVHLVRADAHRLPFPDAVFDGFYCALSWHLLDAPEQVLAELLRVGRGGAELTMSLLGRSRHTWHFMAAVLREFLGTGQTTGSARLQALRRRPPEPVLAAAGWRITARAATTRRFRFETAEAWLAWQSAQLGRGYFDQVPAHRRPELWTRLLAAAERALATEGLSLEQEVTLLRGAPVRADR